MEEIRPVILHCGTAMEKIRPVFLHYGAVMEEVRPVFLHCGMDFVENMGCFFGGKFFLGLDFLGLWVFLWGLVARDLTN